MDTILMTRRIFMKKLMISLVLTAVLAGLAFAPLTHAQKAKEQEIIVIHLSKFGNDLHAVNMALKIAAAMRQAKAKVTLFLDLEGVRLVDKGQPLSLKWGTGKSVGELYTAFVSAGGNTLVCPHCANAAGLTDRDLRKGAKITSEEALAKLLLKADKIMDY
jgi:predicted peroxiredoxin